VGYRVDTEDEWLVTYLERRVGGVLLAGLFLRQVMPC
jgi:hypothetical protein